MTLIGKYVNIPYIFKIMDFTMTFSYMHIMYFDHIYPDYPHLSILFPSSSPLIFP
jgi:hypothetical protein